MATSHVSSSSWPCSYCTIISQFPLVLSFPFSIFFTLLLSSCSLFLIFFSMRLFFTL
ncbi:hypothetical protein Lalb_Chr14g0374521 [Lupinus albus]|uniref:Uncharacterized protein n=1 Tax=Lupinus albus TaxID=3870 RepID=A0A6A4PGJ3_LUPAL|nr:hypothetical protein Lalb_Chr14g0374521 [Lupinus albus]